MPGKKSNITTMQDVFEAEYPSQDRRMTVIALNYNEDPHVVKHTIERIAESNHYAANKGLDFRVHEVIISDQSGKREAKVNRGKIYTAKDAVQRLCGPDFTPEIYHLVFDRELEDILADYLKKEPPQGKGWNMFVSSLATGMYPDDKVGLIYMDVENEQIGPDNIVALGLPISRKKSGIRFTKGAFDRYHMEGDKRLLGGRINASVGVPLIKMFAEKKLMPELYYPLSGEIGIVRENWWKIKIPKKYGVEIGTLLQLLYRENEPDQKIGPLSEDEFMQVYLGLNMDQPLAEGKKKEIIYTKSEEMTRQIALATFGIIGEDIKKYWPGADSFISDFSRQQDKSFRKWLRKDMPIIGKLSPERLKTRIRKVVQDIADRYYSGEITQDSLENEFLPSVKDIRYEIGESDFSHLVSDMTNKKIEIR